jgi:hypothetical protein
VTFPIISFLYFSIPYLTSSPFWIILIKICDNFWTVNFMLGTPGGQFLDPPLMYEHTIAYNHISCSFCDHVCSVSLSNLLIRLLDVGVVHMVPFQLWRKPYNLWPYFLEKVGGLSRRVLANLYLDCGDSCWLLILCNSVCLLWLNFYGPAMFFTSTILQSAVWVGSGLQISGLVLVMTFSYWIK